MSINTIVTDLDDTLIECHGEYKTVLRQGGEYINKVTGLDTTLATELISHIDLTSVKHSLCFQKNRFPTSFGIALWTAGAIVGKKVTDLEASEIVDIGSSVFLADYPLYPGARDALLNFKTRGFELVLYTKGDPDVQKFKIEKHQFAAIFDKIMIIPAKTTGRLVEAMLELNKGPSEVLMVGDSLKDDIAPAKSLGIKTAHVSHSDAWVYGDHDVKPDIVLKSFAELADKLP